MRFKQSIYDARRRISRPRSMSEAQDIIAQVLLAVQLRILALLPETLPLHGTIRHHTGYTRHLTYWRLSERR
jgi:hypothetical protein